MRAYIVRSSRSLLDISALLRGIKHFLAPLRAETLSSQGKEVYDIKMPKTLGITKFKPIRAKSLSRFWFEAILAAVFA